MTTLNQQNTNQEKPVVIGAIRTVSDYEDIPSELIQNTITRIKELGFTGVKVESRKNMPIHVRRLITAVSHPDENVRLCMAEMIRGDRCFDVAYVDGIATFKNNPFRTRIKKDTCWRKAEPEDNWIFAEPQYQIIQELCRDVNRNIRDMDAIYHTNVYVRPDLREQMAMDAFEKEVQDALKEIKQNIEYITELRNKIKYAEEQSIELAEKYNAIFEKGYKHETEDN